MAINKKVTAALTKLFYDESGFMRNYKNIRKIEAVKRDFSIVTRWDHIMDCNGRDIPVRVFTPDNKSLNKPVILFFHGGGWVSGNIESYSPVCRRLSEATDSIVISVEYRLAPEHKFPCGLEDCYEVAKALFTKPNLFLAKPEEITLMGDSAGGNLAAAVSLMARDKGEFFPTKQILIYPSTYNNHGEDSPFPSIKENGEGFILTDERIADYFKYYMSSEEDLSNKYFAPLLETDFSNQPDTLIITAEFDPLRDEGEEYGKRLLAAGNKVVTHRIKDAMHGFFLLPKRYTAVIETMHYIKYFLKHGGGKHN